MKALIGNTELVLRAEQELADARELMKDEILMSWFSDDFAVRFCWSSNAIEGNTLSLEETIALVEYDEVSAETPTPNIRRPKTSTAPFGSPCFPSLTALSPRSGSRGITA